MPGTFFTNLERKRLDEFPQEISMEDIITFFTLSEEDILLVRKRRQAHNQLGFAIQLCTLRYLGFCPNDLNSIPFKVIKIVADQIGVSEKVLSEYGKRKHTQTDHLKEIQGYLGIRNATEADLEEIDKWTQFTDCFHHPGGYKPKNKDMIIYIYASIIAQACNFGLKRMAEITDLSHNQLIWCNKWYLREETLQNAINKLVDFQYYQPLSKYWGDGTLSSSDGQHIPVSVKTKNATALPKYYGYGKGLTFYTWTSDQFSQYGSKVVTSTVRDATYVLDAILDNETELQILEHTTDTAGYTELVFALFDLLGMQFSPRIKDLGDQKLYYFDKKNNCKSIKNILKVKINPKIIIDNWENILRTVVSIKFGWVTASLFISKLQAYPQQNILTKALQEYGRIIKTMFILNYIDSEAYRRRILIQLNKGEALHALRQFLFFANEGIIRKSQFELQSNQLNCLTLLTNAVMVWNTRYMEAVIQNLEQENYQINEDDLKHISPSRFEHINKYGRYNFNIEQEMARDTLRPLRKLKRP